MDTIDLQYLQEAEGNDEGTATTACDTCMAAATYQHMISCIVLCVALLMYCSVVVVVVVVCL